MYNADSEYLLLRKINTLSKTIEVLLTIIHYAQCKNPHCKSGEICVDRKMEDLHVSIKSNDNLYSIHDDV